MTEVRLDKFLPEIIRHTKDPKLTAKDTVGITYIRDKKSLRCLYHLFNSAVTSLKENKNVDVANLFPNNTEYQSLLRYLYFHDQSTYLFILSLYQNDLIGKTYTVSKDFYKIFKEISLDNIQARHLPVDCSGYIELPEPLSDRDDDKIKGFFFYIGDVRNYLRLDDPIEWKSYIQDQNEDKLLPDQKCISCTWLDHKGSTGYFFHPLPEDEKTLLKNSFKNTRFELRTFTPNNVKVNKYNSDGFMPYIAVMLNILAYLKSGNPDLREFRNDIKYKSLGSKTPVRADKNLAQDPITLIGYGWAKDPIWKKTHWVSKPYWAERRYGPGRSLSKVVLCQGSIKQRRINNPSPPLSM